ncbi:PREDICTED: protein FAR1-RELATED SEQUENCE 5-like [Erythranthe guttata]|uniref:protein FAR1-RELATED SEQUENCE 5-like n=1 Tax=Erythranthe guttata TaxID=4155 RepID=UPI00064E119B|nr:PREDICTED: protein FAR1-RELATED SEQUENCE 5-like [Erythranthe guttata]|eukprot:XP_012854487.1 PREDICTED: protein FAR1-RELATED SEQUENCE 5-like [Erythranthe guttata]
MDFNIGIEEAIPHSSYDESYSRHSSNCEDPLNHGLDGGGNSVGFDMKSINEDVVRRLIFESIDDAEFFYSSYANLAGSRIRKQSVKRSFADLIKYREWVCTREGFRRRPKDDNNRKREAKALTRCGCKAGLRVAHDRFSGHYIVTDFESYHNHDFQDFKKRPCLVMDLLKQLARGAGKISFTKKDGYNWLNKVRQERIQGGDINTLLALFESMKVKDDGFFYKYEVDEEDFLRLLKKSCSVDEFEARWANIVEMHEVADKQWVLDTFEKKEKWTEAYFRGHFMAMTWTTQRAESMNSLIKLAVDQKMTITEFVKHYN